MTKGLEELGGWGLDMDMLGAVDLSTKFSWEKYCPG
jgi:hypothetical protein